jgi:hypothetical protein
MVETREVTLLDGDTAITLVQLPSMKRSASAAAAGPARRAGLVRLLAGGGKLLEQDVSKLGARWTRCCSGSRRTSWRR